MWTASHSVPVSEATVHFWIPRWLKRQLWIVCHGTTDMVCLNSDHKCTMCTPKSIGSYWIHHFSYFSVALWRYNFQTHHPPKNRRDFQLIIRGIHPTFWMVNFPTSSWIKNLDFGQWNPMKPSFFLLQILILLWLNPTNIFPKKSGWSLMKPSFFFCCWNQNFWWLQCHPNFPMLKSVLSQFFPGFSMVKSLTSMFSWNLEASINGNTPSFPGLVGGFKDFFFMTFHFVYRIYIILPIDFHSLHHFSEG